LLQQKTVLTSNDQLLAHFAFQVADGNKKQLQVNHSTVCVLCTSTRCIHAIIQTGWHQLQLQISRTAKWISTTSTLHNTSKAKKMHSDRNSPWHAGL